jgi:hypothetical protein
LPKRYNKRKNAPNRKMIRGADKNFLAIELLRGIVRI